MSINTKKRRRKNFHDQWCIQAILFSFSSKYSSNLLTEYGTWKQVHWIKYNSHAVLCNQKQQKKMLPILMLKQLSEVAKKNLLSQSAATIYNTERWNDWKDWMTSIREHILDETFISMHTTECSYNNNNNTKIAVKKLKTPALFEREHKIHRN